MSLGDVHRQVMRRLEREFFKDLKHFQPPVAEARRSPGWAIIPKVGKGYINMANGWHETC
jgi:hypothetical protein